MLRFLVVPVAVLSIGAATWAQEHVGPAQLYPDPSFTPGLAETLDREALKASYSDHCPRHKQSCTYSQDHRDVPASVHRQIYTEYGVPAEARNIQHGEVDHFWPLCAGGSNDISNLWYQPIDNPWNGQNFGFRQKDDLETWICAQIRTNPEFDIGSAYDRVRSDWISYYLEINPPHDDYAE